MTASITRYAPHSAIPAPAMPERADEQHDQRRRWRPARPARPGRCAASPRPGRRRPGTRPTARTAPSRAPPTAARRNAPDEVRRGEQAQDPPSEQRHRRHHPAADQHVVGGDQTVEARRLRVVGDRVGERRPRVLERPHDERHRPGELERDRVQAGQRRSCAGGRRSSGRRCSGRRPTARRARSAARSAGAPAALGGRAGALAGPSSRCAHRPPQAEQDDASRSRSCRAAARGRPGGAPTTSTTELAIVTSTLISEAVAYARSRSSTRSRP